MDALCRRRGWYGTLAGDLTERAEKILLFETVQPVRCCILGKTSPENGVQILLMFHLSGMINKTWIILDTLKPKGNTNVSQRMGFERAN